MTEHNNHLIKNIYYMLAYAFTALRHDVIEEVGKEDFENLHNLFAAILAQGIGLQLKKGLYREYTGKNEHLKTIRGKIDINDSLRDRAERNNSLACEFDELSENNLLNQILKSTLFLLLKHAKVETKYKDQLKQELLFLSNVDLVDLASVHWSRIRFQRNNRSYFLLISICQLISEGMLITTDKGEYKLQSFVDEQMMHRLYEKFILEYYRQEHPELKAHASQIPWALDDDSSTMLPVLQTDIMLEKGNTILIIDAKYYGHTLQVYHEKKTYHSANLNQIFTYVKNKEAGMSGIPHEVSGMLLYARTTEDTLPNGVHHMSGNKICVRTLDLNCDFAEIRRQLDGIVIEFFSKKDNGY